MEVYIYIYMYMCIHMTGILYLYVNVCVCVCVCVCMSGAPVGEDEVVQTGDISSGDYVKVELDPEVFRAMHEGNEETGWDDLMMEVRLHCLFSLHILHLHVNSHNRPCAMCRLCLIIP